MEKETRICLLIFIGSFVFYLATLQDGIISTDENAYMHLSRSIAERFPGEFLQQDEYFEGRTLTGNTGWAHPNGFFVKEGHIYAGVHLGFSLLSAPLYWLLGPVGLQVFNALVASLTLLAIYFGAKRLFDKNTAYLAVILYMFATFSMFYATSMWHHTLAAFGFILAQASFLYLDRGARAMALFALGSAVAVWAAYYMIFPLSILFLLVLRDRKSAPVVLPLAVLLSIAVAYNAQVFDSFQGKTPPITGAVMQFLSDPGGVMNNLVAMVIYREHVMDPWGRWEIQKSLLESSPFLVLSVLGLSVRRPWPLIASNVLFLTMVAGQVSPDFGGYAFNMRYLLPVIPFATIMSAAFIARLFDGQATKFLVVLLSISTVAFYAGGLEMGTKVLSLSFSALLMALALFYYRKESGAARILLTVLLVTAILHSNLVNITDVRTGNQQRAEQSHFKEALEGLTSEGDTLLLPRFSPYEITNIDGRTTIYYQHLNYPDEERKEQIDRILGMVPAAYMVIWVEDRDAMEVAEKYNATFQPLAPHVAFAAI